MFVVLKICTIIKAICFAIMLLQIEYSSAKVKLSYLNFFFNFLIQIESLNLALHVISISIYVSMDKICLIKSNSKV